MLFVLLLIFLFMQQFLLLVFLGQAKLTEAKHVMPFCQGYLRPSQIK